MGIKPMSDRPPSTPGSREQVRLFPLQGTLLLPGTFLPLNVFEPRYRELVKHAMADDRRIGMIQPSIQDGEGALDVVDPMRPPLYSIGCVGSVVECEPQDDGRFWIVLRGEKRFRVVEELEPDVGGYRRVLADLSDFAADPLEIERDLEIRHLLAVAVRFCAAREIDFDIDLLAALAPAQAVNALCAAVPLAAPEKQALLEAAEPESRRDLLVALLEMQLTTPWDPPASYSPPTIN